MNTSENSDKPAIVLVHGAFADGSGWQHVIPLLERDHLRVPAGGEALRLVGLNFGLDLSAWCVAERERRPRPC